MGEYPDELARHCDVGSPRKALSSQRPDDSFAIVDVADGAKAWFRRNKREGMEMGERADSSGGVTQARHGHGASITLFSKECESHV